MSTLREILFHPVFVVEFVLNYIHQARITKNIVKITTFLKYFWLCGNAAKPVKTYLEMLKLKVLPHPPYSPNIAPSDYYLFRSMAYGLADQQFRSYEDIDKWLDSWISSTYELKVNICSYITQKNVWFEKIPDSNRKNSLSKWFVLFENILFWFNQSNLSNISVVFDLKIILFMCLSRGNSFFRYSWE